MKRCNRDKKLVTILSFVKLGATFQVTVSGLMTKSRLMVFSQRFSNRPFLTMDKHQLPAVLHSEALRVGSTGFLCE